MKPTITVSMAEWKMAARELHKTSSRTCVDFINGQAFRVATLALKFTKHADARKIERELGAIGRSVSFKTLTRGKNKGKTRTVKGDYTLAGEDTLGHRILIARRIKTGSFGVQGNLLKDKVRNLIKARIAAVNFIRAGWIPAIKKLSVVVRRKPSGAGVSRDGARMRGVQKGDAKPAVFTLRSIMEAIISNSAMNTSPMHPSVAGKPKKIADEGLNAALRIATLDMKATLEKRLQPDLRRASVR